MAPPPPRRGRPLAAALLLLALSAGARPGPAPEPEAEAGPDPEAEAGPEPEARGSPELPMPPLMVGPKQLHDPYGDKPAAHVVASSWSSSPSPLWLADVAPALVRNGVRLHGNRLVVPRDGLYFVYAAAAFRGGGCPRRPPPPLRLAVSRYSREYPADVPLLTAQRSVCAARCRRRGDGHGRGQAWAESLYQGAVVQLRRGDQLGATATAGGFLDVHGAGRAYFGVLGVD